jgi:hypothetical protein
VSEQAWVSGIEVTRTDAGTTWEVSVTDDQAAEDQLLAWWYPRASR